LIPKKQTTPRSCCKLPRGDIALSMEGEIDSPSGMSSIMFVSKWISIQMLENSGVTVHANSIKRIAKHATKNHNNGLV
jgi:hypothetical protein